MTTPAEAFAALRAAERSGQLSRTADELGLGLIVVFGSAERGEPDVLDLDRAGPVARRQALVPGEPYRRSVTAVTAFVPDLDVR